LQQKVIEIDIFVDRLDNVPKNYSLPEELTLTELILWIKDILSLQNSLLVIINRFTRSTPELSSPHQNDRPPHQPCKPDARSDPRHQTGSDNCPDRSYTRPGHPFCERTQTQFICGRWSHSVENCQQVAMHFLISNTCAMKRTTHLQHRCQNAGAWQMSSILVLPL
jgi:hypothetical protein